MTGTLINVGTIVLGTFVGSLLGGRLPERMQQRVLAGLGLATLVLGLDNALQWRDTNALYVIGGILLGGLAGEALRIEERLEALGARLQARFAGPGSARPGHHTLAEGFVIASLLFCVGPLAVLGAIQDGLTGNYDTLATKALLDGFAAVALASALGFGVGFAAVAVLVYQGAITLAAGLFESVLARRPHQRGRDPHHRDRAQAAGHQGRQGRQLPPGPGLRAVPRRRRQPDALTVGTSRRRPGVRMSFIG